MIVGLYFSTLGVSHAAEVSCDRKHIDTSIVAHNKATNRMFLEKLVQQECIWSYFHLASQDKTLEASRRRHLLIQSAKIGDERSARRLGSLYSFGVGVKKDFVEAYALYRLATYFGDKGTAFLAKKLSLNMRDIEIERAENLFQKWQEDYEENNKIDREFP